MRRERANTAAKICIKKDLLFIFSLVIIICFCPASKVCAFTLRPWNQLQLNKSFTHATDNFRNPIQQKRTENELPNMFSPSISSSEVSVPKLYDANGIEFTEGCLVRVKVSKIKAFHAPANALGKFDETSKRLIPVDKSAPKCEKFFLLPIGLRGLVLRVYDTANLGCNLPIIVKFIKDENGEEGYAPPATFSMHLDVSEIEVVH